jgi:5-methylcytosine-specific restriction endonuclease McrA
VFEALAEGRVNLSGLVCLAAHLTPENSEELLAAASHKTRAEIEGLIAERFPRADVAPSVEAIPSAPLALATDEGAPGPPQGAVILGQADADVATQCAHDRGRVRPLSPEAYAVQFTRSREQDERFRYLQDLLGHQVGRGDLAEAYDRAVKDSIARLERVRFGACAKPRAGRHRDNPNSRYVPAEVKRAVWQRDTGQCTFVSEAGRRCEARGDVEFDHVKEFARGGETTVDNLRLRCRGHNQHAAERTFGEAFMQKKRADAAEAQATKRRSAQNAAVASASA